MTAPPIPAEIVEIFPHYPAPSRARLLDLRELIFALAAETAGVGPLIETLKWGEPAYLTPSGSGTTIRLGAVKSAPEAPAVLFNCKTSLIESFRNQFAEDFAFVGNRALTLPPGSPPREALAFCLRSALTYHRPKCPAM